MTGTQVKVFRGFKGSVADEIFTFCNSNRMKPTKRQEQALALADAAPMLLEALKDLRANGIPGMTKSCGHPYFCTCPWRKAGEAIAKAEGDAA